MKGNGSGKEVKGKGKKNKIWKEMGRKRKENEKTWKANKELSGKWGRKGSNRKQKQWKVKKKKKAKKKKEARQTGRVFELKDMRESHCESCCSAGDLKARVRSVLPYRLHTVLMRSCSVGCTEQSESQRSYSYRAKNTTRSSISNSSTQTNPAQQTAQTPALHQAGSTPHRKTLHYCHLHISSV